MFRTKKEITTTFGGSHLLEFRHTVTVPKGQRVTRCQDSSKQYFVEDFQEWVKPLGGIELHDATHYGIRVNAEDVEEV